jgi:hypothetical protein
MKVSNVLIKVPLLFTFFLVACGSDPAQEGENAFNNADYNIAIKQYLEARKQDPKNKAIDEKIALSYMLKGEDLFKKTRNIKSFSGNFDKATTYIPDTPSNEFNNSYSSILYSLAAAYMKAKPQNDIEREDYLNSAISYLEDAIYYQEANTKADSLLKKIKSDNFQKMLNKGKDYYARARKARKFDLYLSAEYYFKKAAYFDMENSEAVKLLSQTREKTLSILNVRDDLAMAIADQVQQNGKLILDITLRNYLNDPISIDIKKFKIMDKDGNGYAIDSQTMNSKFADKQIKNQKLTNTKDLEGIVVFSVPNKVKKECLAYELDSGDVVKKFFP